MVSFTPYRSHNAQYGMVVILMSKTDSYYELIDYSPNSPNSFIENSTSVNLRIARCRVKLHMNDDLTLNLEVNSYTLIIITN